MGFKIENGVLIKYTEEKDVKEVVIPDSVKIIGESAFRYCESLTVIDVGEKNENYVSVGGVLYDKQLKTLIAYPSGKKDEIYTVPESVESIMSWAFSGPEHLKTLILNDKILINKSNIFINCQHIDVQGLDRKNIKIGNIMSVIPLTFKNEVIQLLITGKAKERRELSGYSEYNPKKNLSRGNDIIAAGCLEYLKNNKYTKTQLTNLAEFFCAGEKSISAVNFAAFYEILLAQKADKALALIPISKIVNNKKDDPDAKLLGKFLGKSSSDAASFKIVRGELEEYYEQEGVTEVVIPKNVKVISNGAFNDCHNITSITIPKSVTEINSSFLGCTSLKEIIVEEGNAEYSSSNGMLLRSGKDYDNKKYTEIRVCPQGLKDGVIPKAVNSIDCDRISHLENVSVEKGSRYFCAENNAIYSKDKTRLIFCSRYAESLDILDTVTSIESKAFYECKKLRSVNIPNSVTSIGSNAFSYCESLASVVIPDSVKKLGFDYSFQAPFSDCKNLTSVTLPKNMEYLGTVFSDCEKLETIELPQNIKFIEESSFKGCKSLREIVIPEGVEQIRNCAFWGCESLEKITVPDSVTELDGIYGDNKLPEENGIKYAGKWAVGYSDIFKDGDDVILREGTVGIRDEIFNRCDEIRFNKIVIPASVKYMDRTTLRGFSEIEVAAENEIYSSAEGVLFDKEMKTLILYPMYKNDSVYTIPDGVERIERTAFENCDEAEKVIIPEGVTFIGESAFRRTSHLAEVELPYTARRIDRLAFVNTFYSRAGKRCDHGLYIYFCKGDIKVPLELKGNWGLNAEERLLSSFVSANSEKEKENIFESLKTGDYKFSLAVFTLLTEKESEFAREYVRKNIKKIIMRFIYMKNVPVINRLLEFGYVTDKNIDELFEYANSLDSGSAEIKMLLMNYKHENFGDSEMKQFKF